MKPLIIAHDAQSKRNVEAILALYDEMINKMLKDTGEIGIMTDLGVFMSAMARNDIT